jgi:hypothetical protein
MVKELTQDKEFREKTEWGRRRSQRHARGLDHVIYLASTERHSTPLGVAIRLSV